MEQEKINKYLKWLEKGIRIFAGGVIVLEIAVMFFAGYIIWHGDPSVMATLPGWQLAVGLGMIILKTFVISYLVFGKWNIEYTKKTKWIGDEIGKEL